jgi:E3 ubiquitin-protein ligase BRE1
LLDKEKMITRLQATITSCAQEQEMLMSEIESIGKAYEEMQDQNQRLLQQLTEKDAIVARFLSEVQSQ